MIDRGTPRSIEATQTTTNSVLCQRTSGQDKSHHKRLGVTSQVCLDIDTGFIDVSLWSVNSQQKVNHRGTEDSEVAQRNQEASLAFYHPKNVRQATLAIACLYLNLTHLLRGGQVRAGV